MRMPLFVMTREQAHVQSGMLQTERVVIAAEGGLQI